MTRDPEFTKLVRWAESEEKIKFDNGINVLLGTGGLIFVLIIFFIVVYLWKTNKKSKKKHYSSEESTLELEPTGMLKNMNYSGHQVKNNIAYASPREAPATPDITNKDKPRKSTASDVKSH